MGTRARMPVEPPRVCGLAYGAGFDLAAAISTSRIHSDLVFLDAFAAASISATSDCNNRQ